MIKGERPTKAKDRLLDQTSFSNQARIFSPEDSFQRFG